jgi:lipopolysaccharide export system protein LptA
MKYLLALLMLMAMPAWAITANAPIEIDADQLVVERTDGTAEFSGNVRVVQGDMRLASDRLKVKYDEAQKDNQDGGVTEIIAKGKVTIVYGADTATGHEAIYDVPAKKVRLNGNVTLVRGENVLRGDGLVFDLVSGNASLTASAKQRVSARFSPEKKAE